MMTREKKEKNEPDLGGWKVQRPGRRKHKTPGELNGEATISTGQHGVTIKDTKDELRGGSRGHTQEEPHSHGDEFGYQVENQTHFLDFFSYSLENLQDYIVRETS